MFTKAELVDAIDEIEQGKHTIQNCEKLASIYTVLDHMYPPSQEMAYSYDNKAKDEPDTVGDYGDSQFLKLVAGKPLKSTWRLIDELVEAVGVLNPRLMDSFIDKISTL